MPKVSVIIPIFGVEQYIEKCARSLFQQSLDDMEFIFVNDCTQDDSIIILKKVLDDYPERASQTIILNHEVNRGLPFARKTGLSKATGEYIAHCDSDDWVDYNMYKLMYEEAIHTEADVVICDYYTSDGKNKLLNKGLKRTDVDMILKDIVFHRISPCVWNKLFKRSIYDNQIDFPKIYMAEDLVLTTQLLFYCKSASSVDKPLYNYFINNTTASRKLDAMSYYNRHVQIKMNTDILINFIESHCHDKRNKANMINYLQYNAIKPLQNIMFSCKGYKNLWWNTYPGCQNYFLFNPEVRLEDKVKLLLTFCGLYPFRKDRI